MAGWIIRLHHHCLKMYFPWPIQFQLSGRGDLHSGSSSGIYIQIIGKRPTSYHLEIQKTICNFPHEYCFWCCKFAKPQTGVHWASFYGKEGVIYTFVATFMVNNVFLLNITFSCSQYLKLPGIVNYIVSQFHCCLYWRWDCTFGQ